MTLQEQYGELLKYRKVQPIDVINSKKRMIWEHFRNIISVSNLEKNIVKNFYLFYAPLNQIRSVNMTCYSFPDGDIEIYVDESYAQNNPRLTSIQETHEVLHGLSRRDNFLFCHLNGQNMYTGIYEYVTQLFTEDIEGQRLTEEEDYLYFGKNIMRVMKIIFGVDKLGNQYFSNNNQFEENFNKVTGDKFDAFASMMNEVYTLSKSKYYDKLDDENIKILSTRKEQIINFTKTLIDTFSKTNEQLIEAIFDELQSEEFSNMLNLKTKRYS